MFKSKKIEDCKRKQKLKKRKKEELYRVFSFTIEPKKIDLSFLLLLIFIIYHTKN